MKKNLYIGLAGVSKAGKDSFCKLLKEELTGIIRCSIGDQIREELRAFCIKHYNINPFDCSPEEKEIIRPLLVLHGNYKRQDRETGRYWFDLALNQAEYSLNYGAQNIVVFTDIRRAGLKGSNQNEAKLIKDIGILVHISRYYYQNGIIQYIIPANQSEAENNPLLEKMADYRIVWSWLWSEEKLRETVKDFVKCLKSNQKLPGN